MTKEANTRERNRSFLKSTSIVIWKQIARTKKTEGKWKEIYLALLLWQSNDIADKGSFNNTNVKEYLFFVNKIQGFYKVFMSFLKKWKDIEINRPPIGEIDRWTVNIIEWRHRKKFKSIFV